MNQIRSKILTLEEMTTLYEEHLIKDFPSNEWKPLEQILKLMEEGNYKVYGFYEEETLRAYALLCLIDTRVFLDFFAVADSDKRGKGYGSRVLKDLLQILQEQGKELLILEAEAPERAETEEARITRNRRIQFYLGNQLCNSPVRGQVQGVEFHILYYSFSNGTKTGKELGEILSTFYRKLYSQGGWNVVCG